MSQSKEDAELVRNLLGTTHIPHTHPMLVGNSPLPIEEIFDLATLFIDFENPSKTNVEGAIIALHDLKSSAGDR